MIARFIDFPSLLVEGFGFDAPFLALPVVPFGLTDGRFGIPARGFWLVEGPGLGDTTLGLGVFLVSLWLPTGSCTKLGLAVFLFTLGLGVFLFTFGLGVFLFTFGLGVFLLTFGLGVFLPTLGLDVFRTPGLDVDLVFGLGVFLLAGLGVLRPAAPLPARSMSTFSGLCCGFAGLGVFRAYLVAGGCSGLDNALLPGLGVFLAADFALLFSPSRTSTDTLAVPLGAVIALGLAASGLLVFP